MRCSISFQILLCAIVVDILGELTVHSIIISSSYKELLDKLSLDYSEIMREIPTLFHGCLLNSDYWGLIRNYLSLENENLLHIACRLNRVWFIPLLLEIGCDKNQRNNCGQIPADVARYVNHIQCIKARAVKLCFD